jgi:hypothetical protein
MTDCTLKKAPAIRIPLPCPSEILEQISRKDLLNKDVKGLARITVQSTDGKYSTACAIILRFPNALRVETLPPIGPPNLFLAINGESLKVYLPGKEVFYIGKTTADNISRFLPFPLEAKEIIPILLGGLPPDFQPNGASLKINADNELYRVDVFFNGKRIRSACVDPSSGELKKIELLEPDGGMIYSAKLEDYRMINGISLPQSVELRFGALEVSILRVRYSDLQLFPGEDAALYDLEIPSGIKPTPLD